MDTGSDVSTLERLKSSCARIKTATSIGSGFLVSPDTLVTCQHVVKDVAPGASVLCAFDGDPDDKAIAAALIDADAALDVAVLRLSSARVEARPLPLASTWGGKAWSSLIYPAFTQRAGVPVDGEVKDWKAKDPDGKPAIALYSEMFQARPLLGGSSGSPLVCDGHIVGIVYRVLGHPSEHKVPQLGMCYAVPFSELPERLKEALPVVVRSSTEVAAVREFRLDGGDGRLLTEFPRPDLVQRVIDAVLRFRCCIVVGPRGIGKTTLATMIARRHVASQFISAARWADAPLADTVSTLTVLDDVYR